MRNISRKIRNTGLSLAIGAAMVVGGGFMAAPTPAYAIYCLNCSTFYQQMFEYVEAINTALNTADQLATQTKQYSDMVTQGNRLPSSMHRSITSDLSKVRDVYTNAKSLGRKMENLEAQFKTEFPGYEGYLNNMSNASEMAPKRFEQWSEMGRDNARTAMESANINTGTFDTEDQQLATMVSRSQSASGRMQAIQAGNEIAAQNVQQLQKLRDLAATQITMQGNYMALQQAQIDADNAQQIQRRSAVIKNTGSDTEY